MRMFSITALALVCTGYMGAEEATAKPATATQAQQEGAPVGTPVYTSGKVTSIHNCPLVGVAAPHVLVKLTTEQGDTEIVDLGSVAELKRNGVEPKEGQQLWIDGQVGKINDKFLIVAECLSETKMVMITQDAPLSSESVKHADAHAESATAAHAETSAVTHAPDVKDTKDPKAPKTETVDAGQKVRTVEGTVIHTRHVKIEGEADEHMLAKLQTASGIAVLDLGNCAAMPNTVNLAEGQTIVATGFVGQLNGKPIILADSVGNLTALQHTNAPETK